MGVDELGQAHEPASLVVLSDRGTPIAGATIPTEATVLGWGYVGTGTRRRLGHVHAGVDVGTGSAPGTPVRAPEAAIVEEVGMLPAPRGTGWSGYAPCVLLRGASGRWHLLAHLSGDVDGNPTDRPAVAVGARLRLGDVVGYVGRERHTHWEVRTRPHARGEPTDPRRTIAITINPARWIAGEEVQAPPPDHPLSRRSELDPWRGPHRRRHPEEVLTQEAWAQVCSSLSWSYW
jgi:murein DD-endopeptidase MepM/ murein hydrolase activator NlpD